MVLFQKVKRTNGSSFDAVALGTARLATGATVAVRNPGYLFERDAPDAGPLYSSGAGVADGFAYFFGCESVGYLDQGCRVARVPVGKADQRNAFEFFDGSAWQASPSKAAVVIDHAGSAASLSFNAYLQRYLLVSSGLLNNDILLRTAEKVQGPWSNPVTLAPGDGGILMPGDPNAFDDMAIEHPELASPDGTQIVVSHARPMGNFRGEVRLVQIRLR